MTIKKALPLVLLLIAAFALVACQPQTVEVEVPVEVTRIVEVEVTAADGMAIAPDMVPFYEMWVASGHNDTEAEAFIHWNEDDPAEVPVNCAKCHNGDGYRDFLGADGSAAGVVDMPGALGVTVTCNACHNEVTATKTSVVMPSGIELTGLGDESRCMECHQGRAWGGQLDATFTELGVTDWDVVTEGLRFTNIHYYAAAATKYGTMSKGGYEYAGKTYDGFFAHVEGYETCIDCHNPHTLEVKVEECAVCHGVESVEELRDVRMVSSAVDYDGDGDIEEGISYEIVGLQEMLYAAIQAYATDVLGTTITYDAHAYPYFFNEAGEGYSAWSPRLLAAAYNYQVSLKDTGAFAHGGKYIIELLYDSIEDLNAGIDLSSANRIDHGHFAGSEEAFRHWDEEGEVPASCARCHSATGLPLFLEQGVTINAELSNGFLCSTCHNEEAWPERYAVTSVTFPSGAVIESEEPQAQFLCMTCHQGRASGSAVARALAGKDADTVDASVRFTNIHYFAAGATRYGSDVNGMYQFEGKEYVGLFAHVEAADECTECHDAHELEVQVDKCATCHGTEDVAMITFSGVDYDGDGLEEGLAGEIATFAERLYAAMQVYSADVTGFTIVYDSHSYPYFFTDAGERYSTFTPNLAIAAYNYQYAQKDPGAFAHNGKYVLQALYDTIEAMDGDLSGLTRP